MEFTGERYVPGTPGLEELYVEHMSRYRFVKALAAGRLVLDVGSGCGYGTFHLAAAGARWALGIDVSPEAVIYSRASYRRPNLQFAVMDASRLCLGVPFDLVTCFELIEHVEDAEAVLAGVHQVLDERGVFVVSTPNKATYVAGGDEGKNPFHVREYYRDEFEDLLGGTFPEVTVLGQEWVEGMALVGHPDLVGPGDTPAGRLPGDGPSERQRAARSEDLPQRSVPTPVGTEVSGRTSGVRSDGGGSAMHGAAGNGEPPYFIGLCAKQPIPPEVISALCPLAFYGSAVRYSALKRAALELEREFDRRGIWAQGLDQENRSKDEVIKALRLEIEALRRQFAERGRWAERLNGELRQSGALVERLAGENRRLRDELASRQAAGWSKGTR